MAFLLTSLYFGATFCLFIYGVQCYVMMALFLRRYESGREENGRIEADAPTHLTDYDWPAVLTQIPIFNERQVAERCLRAVAAIDYPRGKHRIQVLDDSIDETSAHVDEVVADLQRAGHAIEVLRRTHRTGFKAGALTAGLACTEHHRPTVEASRIAELPYGGTGCHPHRQRRSKSAAEPQQGAFGLQQCGGVDSSLVEQVAGNEDKINLPGNGILDSLPECPAKVLESLLRLVLLVA